MNLVRLLRDRQGGVAPLLALTAIPLLASVGAAVDYSRANAARTAMQGSLDATALMLSKAALTPSTAPADQSAAAYFNANFKRSDMQAPEVTATMAPVAGGVSVRLSAAGSINTEFMRLVGISTVPISVNSAAVAVADGFGCVLSLNKTVSGAVTGQGSTVVNLNGCSLYDDSASNAALTVGGTARISALSVGVVGGISGKENLITTNAILTGIGAVLDPYAGDSFPNFSGCSYNKFTAKSTVTIDPGVFCGGIGVNAGADVTMNPGIYYLDGGSLSINGGAKLAGSGVTLVFTRKTSSDWATATINGNATVNLTPPKSGPTAGIVVFGDRGIPVGTTFKFNGGVTQYFGGAIYVPTGAITFAGGAGTSTSCTQIIGDTITFVGNSALAINCSNSATKPFSPIIVKLLS